MEPAKETALTEDEYLDLERRSETKHEFVDGHMVAMSGATLLHNLLVGNLVTALSNRLRGRCIVLPSDQRVHAAATGLYTYPDVTVVCGAPKMHTKDRNTLVNPLVVIEVLSPSTEAYDRGDKFAHYRSLSSIQEYLLVSQHGQRVEHYRRIEVGQWLLTTAEGDGTIAFPVLGVELPLVEIYQGVDQLPPDTVPET